VEADLAGTRPMHRLVQGDVGSGKTVIAALAAARAIECGFQVALMAPTEILAEQHFRKIAQWLEPLDIRVAWLAGRLTASAKRAAQQAVRSGLAQLVVGTHALIQDAVDFHRLGLAIVDEQHRFGVAQRLALRGDDERGVLPHMLMLSATPIPRTLAMSYLADLDVSVIDEMPPGRRPVVTKLVSMRRREEVMERIRAEARAGRQAYWVCPLVEASDVIEATAATETHERITQLLPDLRIGLLHGQLPPAEKSAVMRAFIARELDVLVATTVIEVGVDVANATLMVIEHAERFGLAQLHQLRGRVGRGADDSFCILLYDDALSDVARERLKVIYETADGFEVARRDLMMRGPGEFLGARQSGAPLLRFADLERDAALVERARAAATDLLAHEPAAAAAHVRRWYEGRHAFLTA
ncbi:MAG: ATP-dependent DNA helicase RecG, partial [Burkholderiaceae bacterium]|nr:ATP-dependent DNA helicase RecG [Burkholderiaceae bacterium]